ncbi:MAG TPA: hypothetical protein VGA37_17360 [Gemmatimonadales bacterium]
MTPFERWSVWLTSAVSVGTGVVYLWMKYFMETDEPWAVVNHPWQPWLLKAHILTAPLLLLVLGAVLFNHVPYHLREEGRPRLLTGLVVLAGAAAMILSGYLVQVLPSERAIEIAALAHIVTSFLFVAALVAHSVRFGSTERATT